MKWVCHGLSWRIRIDNRFSPHAVHLDKKVEVFTAEGSPDHRQIHLSPVSFALTLKLGAEGEGRRVRRSLWSTWQILREFCKEEQSVYQTAALNRQQNIFEIYFYKIERFFKVSAVSSSICRHDFELSTFWKGFEKASKKWQSRLSRQPLSFDNKRLLTSIPQW